MLPREIETEHWPDRATFTFPPRPLGMFRLVGLLPMAFSIFFDSVPMRQLWKALHPLVQGKSGGLEWFLVVFLSVFVLAGLIPFVLGLFILAGRTRLAISSDKITVTEIAGPLRWRRKVRVANLERLEIAAGLAGENASRPFLVNRSNEPPESAPRFPASGQGAVANPFARFGALAAVMSSGRKVLLLLGYPADWMPEVAGEISEFLRSQGKRVSVSRTTAAGEIEDHAAPIDKPAGTLVTLVETSQEIRLTVPSRGFWKESNGLILFATLWCGFMSVFTVAAFFGRHSDDSQPAAQPGLWLGVLAFWAIGVGMMSLGIHLGTRRWSLSADSSSLRASLKSALRSREWQWSATDISELRANLSNVKVNNRRLEELQVHTHAGKQTNLLRGRDHAELVWIAALLRRKMQVGPPDSTSPS